MQGAAAESCPGEVSARMTSDPTQLHPFHLHQLSPGTYFLQVAETCQFVARKRRHEKWEYASTFPRYRLSEVCW